MENSIKTNRMAIVSFISGLIAILIIGLIIVLYNLQKTADGIISITDGIIMPLQNLSVIIALLTGILALRQIKKKGETEKGKIFAWVGIVIGAGWIIFRWVVGITFLLAEILH